MQALQNILRSPSNAVVDKFNARVSDYNSRCASFRASRSEAEAADRATAAALPRIEDEAQALASEWNQ